MKFWRGIGGGGLRLSDGYVSTARPESTDRMRAIRSEQPGEALPAIVAASYFDAAGGGAVTHEVAGTLTAATSLAGGVTVTWQGAGTLAAAASLTANAAATYNLSATLTAAPVLTGTLAGEGASGGYGAAYGFRRGRRGRR